MRRQEAPGWCWRCIAAYTPIKEGFGGATTSGQNSGHTILAETPSSQRSGRRGVTSVTTLKEMHPLLRDYYVCMYLHMI